MSQTAIEQSEILAAVEGEAEVMAFKPPQGATVAAFLKHVAEKTGRDDFVELDLEDADAPLPADAVLSALTAGDFKLVHVVTAGVIVVHVVFNGKTITEKFRPSATMAKIIRWAVATYPLEGDPCDFQLKLGDKILPPEAHLGQIARGQKQVKLQLVTRVKPQG